MADQLNWGIVGTGGIAADFAEALRRSRRCRVVNVCGSSPAKARAFAERFGLAASARSLDDLLADAAVDAVYVATPHPLHEPHAVAALRARKPVLCEKPLAADAAAAERIVEAARASGTFLMEAFMYRCHPLLRELIHRLQDGAIGALRHVRADFGFRVPRDPAGRLFDVRLGGGAILDVGGYPMSLARLVAGLAAGTGFAEPESLQAVGVVGPTGADELATASLRFGTGMTATVTCAVRHDVGRTTVIFGEQGRIVLADPWIPGSDRQGRQAGFVIYRDNRDPEEVTVSADLATYAIEAELVADSLPGPEAAWPAMAWADTLGNMRALEAWRAALDARPALAGGA
jgi:predicted dehydrogenase